MSPIFYHSRKLVITIFNKLQKSTFTTLSSTFQSTTSQHIIKLSNKNIVTTVTNQASIVEKWLTNITSLYKTSPLIIGIDCEWKPQFTKGASINKVAVLQLCVDENCILLQLLHMDHIPTMLKEFLNNPRVTLVGVGLKADLTRLRKSHEIECSCAVEDISVLAVKTPGLGFEGRPYPSLRNLALGILGTTKEDSKRVTFSNWEARVLSEGQIMYACLDAALSYQIGYKLLKQGGAKATVGGKEDETVLQTIKKSQSKKATEKGRGKVDRDEDKIPSQMSERPISIQASRKGHERGRVQKPKTTNGGGSKKGSEKRWRRQIEENQGFR